MRVHGASGPNNPSIIRIAPAPGPALIRIRNIAIGQGPLDEMDPGSQRRFYANNRVSCVFISIYPSTAVPDYNVEAPEQEAESEFGYRSPARCLPGSFTCVAPPAGINLASLMADGDKEIWLLQIPKKLGLSNLDGVEMSIHSGSSIRPSKEGNVEVGSFNDEEGTRYVLDGESTRFSEQLCVVLPPGNDSLGSPVNGDGHKMSAKKKEKKKDKHKDSEKSAKKALQALRANLFVCCSFSNLQRVAIIMLRFIHTGILASLATFRFPYELGLVALSVTAFLTYGTSPNLWRNIPAGMLIVAGAWGYLRLKQLEEQTAIQQLLKKQKSSITECSPDEVPIPGGVDRSQVSTEDRHKAWREKVGSKVVEFAWEKFSNCIIQQWLYDTWWASISPDKEFPAEIRRLLNTSFGEICARAQNLDYRELLIRNCCDILTKNIELYRLTRAAVGEDTLKAMTPAARERALQAEMKASGNLHVALCAPENHYKVLRGLSESLIVHSLSGEPSLRTPIRPLLREVTSYCVLRPLIMYFLPPNLNKLVLQVLPEPATGSAVPIPCSPERKDAAALKAARELAMSKYMVEGVHLMDARVQENVVAENIMMRELAEQRNRRRTARSLVKDGRLPPPSASTPNLMSSQTSPPAPVESNMSNMSLSSSVYRSSE
eukprot:gene27694-7336_t